MHYLSSDSETYPDQWAMVETDGEGGVEGRGQMDGRLAGAAGTEPGPLGGFLHARNRERVGPPGHHVADQTWQLIKSYHEYDSARK